MLRAVSPGRKEIANVIGVEGLFSPPVNRCGRAARKSWVGSKQPVPAPLVVGRPGCAKWSRKVPRSGNNFPHRQQPREDGESGGRRSGRDVFTVKATESISRLSGRWASSACASVGLLFRATVSRARGGRSRRVRRPPRELLHFSVLLPPSPLPPAAEERACSSAWEPAAGCYVQPWMLSCFFLPH